MHREPQSIPAAAAAASSSSAPPVGELNARIPLLQKIKQDDPRFTMLRELLTEMVATRYDPQRKEETMYKVIKIDSLLNELLPGMEPESAVDQLEKYKEQIEIQRLSDVEQRALFVLYRNIFADFSHFLNDDEIKQHLERFSLLCTGVANPAALSEVKSDLKRLTKTPRLQQILSKEDVDLQRTTRLLCQTGYYLVRAKELVLSGNTYGACMALVSAGNCARYFHYSGANQGKCVKVTEEFVRMRNALSHNKFSGLTAEQLLESINEDIEKVDTYVRRLQDEARGLRINVNTAIYVAQNSSATSSPQTFDRRIFEEKDVEKLAVSTSSLGTSRKEQQRDYPPSSSSSSSSSSYYPSRDRGYDRGRGRDFGGRDDRQRHERSYSPSPHGRSSSSSSTYYQSYGSDRYRDRDRDYGSGSRREGYDRSYPPPPPYRSHQASSSSSSYSERRDERSSSSSTRHPEPSPDLRHQTQLPETAREEAKESKHDSKRARVSGGSCQDDDLPKFSRKDDHDDDEKRLEKRSQVQPFSSSSLSSSSSQKSGSHPEQRGSSSYSGSRTHSGTQHESSLSSSLPTSYGSSLGRQKDWGSIKPTKQQNIQPTSSLATESSQQIQAKRERTQTEQEIPEEEQRSGLKRRF